MMDFVLDMKRSARPAATSPRLQQPPPTPPIGAASSPIRYAPGSPAGGGGGDMFTVQPAEVVVESQRVAVPEPSNLAAAGWP